MSPYRLTLTALLLLSLLFAAPGALRADDGDKPDKPGDEPDKVDKAAQPDEKDKKTDTKKDDEKKASDAPKTVADIVKYCDHIPGLFDLYRHREKGWVYAIIRPEQIGKEYIHFTYVENGVARLGLFRGSFRGSRVFTIQKDYNRLRFVVEPTAYYYDKDNALSRAADANVSPAVLAAPTIHAVGQKSDGDLEGCYAVYLDGMFLKELWHQVKPSDSKNDSGFKLGGLSDERTRYNRIRNYPNNTDIVVDYTYADVAPKARAESEDGVVDSRYVTITLQHSLIEMPHNGYKPRYDDERVGFFTTQVDDMTSTSATPWRDLIHRWDLRKKDPKAPLSEPVEPITFWIENTTPVQWRDTIRAAALQWNLAFEAAGFKNAVVVKQQPDDAEWDAGDLRYNVLRWTSSPDPSFGGYGPSFVNPRTGQILGADIMLEWIYVTNRVKMRTMFTDEGAALAALGDQRYCAAGHFAHENTMVGLAALRAFGAPDVTQDKLLRESLYYLVLHEIGHTLGLNHNMAASNLFMPDQINDAAKTEKIGLTGSVMDYPAINLALPGEKQGQYFTDRPGPYDVWAITFGYKPELDDPAAREAHLARSSEPALLFGNDADDMRSSGNGIDPRININDMTGDVVTWADQRFRLIDATLDKLLDRYLAKGRSLQEIRDAYFSLQRHRRTVASVVSRYIGGVYVDRSAAAASKGDKGREPYTPVDEATQKRALKVLAEHVFAPDALGAPPELLAHLRAQRRGFEFSGKAEDPHLHDAAREVQDAALGHLTFSTTLERMTDARLYGNTYTVAQMFNDLTDAIFAADTKPGVNVNTFRQDVQVNYVERLIRLANVGSPDGGFDDIARNAATWQLTRIVGMLPDPQKNPGANLETKAHHNRLKLLIEHALTPGK
ncbi:MAG: DUF5117 domain-containing protein [Phycisphaera sp.]|nr:DUF5117 domain-containing protein [Phycisphaera sp.]